MRRAGESGHRENADRFGGGPFLDHLQRAAESPDRGHEPVVTETLIVCVAVPKTHDAPAAARRPVQADPSPAGGEPSRFSAATRAASSSAVRPGIWATTEIATSGALLTGVGTGSDAVRPGPGGTG